MNSLQKMPVDLQIELTSASPVQRRNVAEIYDLLDRTKGPIKSAAIQQKLRMDAHAYRAAVKVLHRAKAIYATQDGLLLNKTLATLDERNWHLAWSLGSFEFSGRELTLDVDLLKQVPDALRRLQAEGKWKEKRTIERLQNRTAQAIGVLTDVINMYQEIQHILGVASLSKITGSDWKGTMGEIKKELKRLPAKKR